jgi:cholesterol oxidase
MATLDETRADVIVVGSGFGGAVMAARLAEAGLGVRVLERGRAYPPGSFPRSPRAMRENFWDPVGGRYGLFDVWSFRHLDALVASGLGGGSLIYANVLLRKDERWFVQEDLQRGGYEYWPVTRADLDPHYDRVEETLRPQPYPFHLAPYSDTPKTQAFRAAAAQLGLQPFLPPLAVTFAGDDGVFRLGEPFGAPRDNLHGRTRLTCRLCGECDIGCNYGSKNTLDLTYLSAAQRAGADVRTGCDVTALEPGSRGGYVVHYVEHPGGRAVAATADRVVLAAGALGSTRLLLRSRDALPGLSPALGLRFGGNGDLLTFAVGCTTERDGRRVPLPIDPSYGPVITAALRIGDELDGEGWWEHGDPEEDWEGEGGAGRGFYLEDGGFPDVVAWLLLAAAAPGALGRVVGESLRHRWRGEVAPAQLRQDLIRVLEPAEHSAELLPLLAMGRDLPDGRLSLRGGELDLAWTKGTAGRYFHRIRATARRMAAALGGRMVDNPLWLLGRVITVHPLGGCPMGRTPQEGVVDPDGEVFGYPGLYVADGAVMPGPVGANPSLTIAALADRFADRLLESAGRAD